MSLPQSMQANLYRDGALILCCEQAAEKLRRWRRHSDKPMRLLVPFMVWRVAGFNCQRGWPCVQVDGETVWLIGHQFNEFGCSVASGHEGSV